VRCVRYERRRLTTPPLTPPHKGEGNSQCPRRSSVTRLDAARLHDAAPFGHLADHVRPALGRAHLEDRRRRPSRVLLGLPASRTAVIAACTCSKILFGGQAGARCTTSGSPRSRTPASANRRDVGQHRAALGAAGSPARAQLARNG